MSNSRRSYTETNGVTNLDLDPDSSTSNKQCPSFRDIKYSTSLRCPHCACRLRQWKEGDVASKEQFMQLESNPSRPCAKEAPSRGRFCPSCNYVFHRDVVGCYNILFRAIHEMAFGKPPSSLMTWKQFEEME